MSNLRVEPFKLEDAKGLPPVELFGAPAFPFAVLERLGTAKTITKDSSLVAVMGLVKIRDGVCEVFLMPTPKLAELSYSVARELKKCFNETTCLFNRVQATGIDDDKHNRLFIFLGMKREGTMRKYGPHGEDYGIWAVVK